MPGQHAHVVDAPARRHAPAGARLRDLHRQLAAVDLGDDQPVARRIFERDIDLFAVDLDVLRAHLHLVRGIAERDLPFRGRPQPVAELAVDATSEERGEGKEWYSTWRFRGAAVQLKK